MAALPLVQSHWNFAPEPRLYGAVTAPKHVALTTRSYLSGAFQEAFEQRFNARLGFRSQWVRSDNQLNLSAFKELTPSLHTALILGKNGFIYEREYVDSFNRRDLVSASLLEEKVVRLKLLQDHLAKQGSAVVLVISPSKPMLYPEYLPGRFVHDQRQTLPTNYDVFVPLLRKYGIHFIDSQHFLSEWKSSQPFTLFANTGAHWNDPAACNVTSQIVSLVETQLEEPLLALRCGRYVMHDAPRNPDRDLLRLANLWLPERLHQPTPYSKVSVGRKRGAKRPTFLLVGSSYAWALLNFLESYRIDEEEDTFFYYYRTKFLYPGKKRSQLDRTVLDWEKDVFGKNAIVIEINASAVQNVGWGFLEDAERAIRGPS